MTSKLTASIGRQRMHQRDQFLGRHRRLFAHQDLEALVFQRLFDRAHAVRPFRVARRGLVVDTGGVRDQECGHFHHVTLVAGCCKPRGLSFRRLVLAGTVSRSRDA